jgi:uncharacterized protein with von Willebrand factor type A (vWA) domain
MVGLGIQWNQDRQHDVEAAWHVDRTQKKELEEKSMEKTLRELLNRIAAHNGCMDVDIESITQYQDLFGHASVEENIELSNTPELRETYYRVYGVAYGTIEAIRHYCKYSQFMADMKYEIEKYKELAELKTVELKTARESILELEGQLKECKRDMDGTVNELEAHKGVIDTNLREISRLKVKLYDLMEENEMLRQKAKG